MYTVRIYPQFWTSCAHVLSNYHLVHPGKLLSWPDKRWNSVSIHDIVVVVGSGHDYYLKLVVPLTSNNPGLFQHRLGYSCVRWSLLLV